MKALIVLLANAILLVAPAAAQNVGERIAGPTVKVGDVWMYNKINARTQVLEDISVNTIKSIDAKGIVMESTALDGSGASRIQRTRDFNLVRIDGPDFVQETLPFYPNFSFPLWIGKTWAGKVDFSSSKGAGDQLTAKLTARVVGWESVTVPAGNFLALKIEMKGQYQGMQLHFSWPLWGEIEDTVWYAPEVRNAVRYEYKDTNGAQVFNHEVQELVRYWLNP